jgi:hypothetical protein
MPHYPIFLIEIQSNGVLVGVSNWPGRLNDTGKLLGGKKRYDYDIFTMKAERHGTKRKRGRDNGR